jgi:hypothetical protein
MFARCANHIRHVWPAALVRAEGLALRGITIAALRGITAKITKWTVVFRSNIGVTAITHTRGTPMIHLSTPPIVSTILILISALVEPVPALFQAKGTGDVALRVTKGVFLLI